MTYYEINLGLEELYVWPSKLYTREPLHQMLKSYRASVKNHWTRSHEVITPYPKTDLEIA